MHLAARQLGEELAPTAGTHQFIDLPQKIVRQDHVCSPAAHIGGHYQCDINMDLLEVIPRTALIYSSRIASTGLIRPARQAGPAAAARVVTPTAAKTTP